MSILNNYDRVTLPIIETAIDAQVRRGDNRTDLKRYCRMAMENQPGQFVHCAEMLRENGYGAVVKHALQLTEEQHGEKD